jgi:NTP pyrophosphatase (non-canonical NTP hydrolase)
VAANDGLQQLRDEAKSDSELWFPGTSNDLMYHSLGLGGESGEFLNVVKKLARGSLTLQEAVPMMRDELTDVFVYFLTSASVLDMDIMEEYRRKRAINAKRFGRSAN